MMTFSISFGLAVAALAFGYLCGSVPFGLLLTRMAGLGDIRAIGSGNIGATNVLRTGNKKLAAATLLLDALKGTVAVLIARSAFGVEAGLIAGLGAFLGHLFPVWLKFKGGKGVATYIGVLLGLWWPAAITFCLIWLAAAFAFRISSLSAFIASALVPVLVAASALLLQIGDLRLAVIGVALTALLWWKHRANLQRLLAGTEPKIGK